MLREEQFWQKYNDDNSLTAQWRENWSSASVVNHTIVTDPTIRQTGFDLPHHMVSA